jgi:hypothetical protein
MAFSTFGFGDICKADDDSDHAGLKYTGAGIGGAVVGQQAGARLGARGSGMTYGQNLKQRFGTGYQAGRGNLTTSQSVARLKAIPGTDKIVRGARLGTLGGIATGVGGVALARHFSRNKNGA